MFERWRSFTLSKENFKETIEAIGETLKALGVSEKEAETGKELATHIYSLQLAVRYEVSVKVTARKATGEEICFEATVRIDTPTEGAYYAHGGILQYVLRSLIGNEGQ